MITFIISAIVVGLLAGGLVYFARLAARQSRDLGAVHAEAEAAHRARADVQAQLEAREKANAARERELLDLRDQVRDALTAENQQLREKLEGSVRHGDALGYELVKLKAERSLAWPKPERRMKERDVLGEFDVPIDEPWFVAVHQELDDAISDLLDEVTQAPSATLTTERRTHIAGGAESLREFQKRLLKLQHRAANTDDELEEEDKAS